MSIADRLRQRLAEDREEDRKLVAQEAAFRSEWLEIRKNIVLPVFKVAPELLVEGGAKLDTYKAGENNGGAVLEVALMNATTSRIALDPDYGSREIKLRMHVGMKKLEDSIPLADLDDDHVDRLVASFISAVTLGRELRINQRSGGGATWRSG